MSGFVKVTPKVAMRILELQEFRCALSGRTLTPETAALDHIVPLARGGEHTAANIWILHRDVNRAKGTLLMSEFYALCEQAMTNRPTADRMQQLASTGWQSPTSEKQTHEEVSHES
jgi:hypothetical protein